MNNYIGPKQRPIIDAMKDGAELLQRDGRWRILHDKGVSYFVDRERCMGLYTRGFLMENGLGEQGWRYSLTEKGKRA